MDASNQIPSRLVYRANATAFAGGVIAGLLTSIVFALARMLGITAMNFEMIVGGLLTQNHNGSVTPATWMLGFVAKLLMSGVIGWLYSGGFRLLGRAGWDLGAAFGVIHWVIGGTILGMSASSGQIMQDTGYYGLNFGWPTFVLWFLVHVLFGAVVGGLYLPARAAISDQGLIEERKRAFRKVA
jgi:hypothetical protein